MRTGIHEAVAVLVQALGFFGRHYAVVAAFGVLASAQRFLAVGGGGERFGTLGDLAAGVVGEVFTALVRVAFLVWLVAALFRGADVRWSQVGARLGRFVDGHVPMLLASGVLLLLLTVVFKVAPDAVGHGLDPDARPTFVAWELAIKNVTIIPFVMVWMTVLAHVAVVGGPGTLAADAPEHVGTTTGP